ncbi:MAG: pyridoxal-phosphate dependent enzyme [Chloroflexi bacterium]|nr:pyridoxal-phosphate dependent enzyme [Chloroflexota bacterium]
MPVLKSRGDSIEPLLFQKYPALKGHIAWQSLGNFPTPVRKLEKLGKEIGHQNIWIKQDDKSSDAYGGNKVRKLEFILPEALRLKRKTIITFGGIGTNHGLATTIHGRRLGLDTLLVLVDQPVTAHVQEDLLLFHHFGAEICRAHNTFGAGLRTIGYFLTRPGLHFVPTGGSSPLGALGFVNAAFELKNQIESGQLPEPKYIFLALGSKGTLAGLMVGCRLAGLKSTVIGVRVAYHWLANEKNTAKLANSVISLMRRHDKAVPDISFSEKDIHVVHDFFGEGYGFATSQGKEALGLIARTENVELDLTYTAKAFAALLDFVKKHRELGNTPILFWHTYSSVDLTTIVKQDHDYTKLPGSFHDVFQTNMIPYI